MFTFDDGIGTLDRPGPDSVVRDEAGRSDDAGKVDAVGAGCWAVEELDGGGCCCC